MIRKFRLEKDSMGSIKVPAEALWGAQTQRAVENFPVSGIRFGRRFIQALGLVKAVAARVNAGMGKLSPQRASAIERASMEVAGGRLDEHFPLDVYQTGSGTSTNMNANEVIAARASRLAGKKGGEIHPNDHVNFGQSSNDVIPTAIRVAAAIAGREDLLPSLALLREALLKKGREYRHVSKTGRTHLMDAMPLTIQQEFGGYARQMELGGERVRSVERRLLELPLGGTAVGTGINTDPRFGRLFAAALAKETGIPFREAKNHFEAQAAVDAPVELSGALKTVAVSLMKVANDLRWMNSGPNAGLGEIQLAALQPGSSIMPGKVNPVIEESTAMVCAQVIGNDAAIALGGLSGNFELNVMLPLVAHNLLESIRLLANASRNLAVRSIPAIRAREARIADSLGKNPILVTALNPVIGYDAAAKIAKRAFGENRSLKEVALEMTNLSEARLDAILDPIALTRGGIQGR